MLRVPFRLIPGVADASLEYPVGLLGTQPVADVYSVRIVQRHRAIKINIGTDREVTKTNIAVFRQQIQVSVKSADSDVGVGIGPVNRERPVRPFEGFSGFFLGRSRATT